MGARARLAREDSCEWRRPRRRRRGQRRATDDGKLHVLRPNLTVQSQVPKEYGPAVGPRPPFSNGYIHQHGMKWISPPHAFSRLPLFSFSPICSSGPSRSRGPARGALARVIR